MRLTFHGAARTVTGSQHLLEVNGSKILLDCGIYQGKRQESYERNLNLPFNAAEVDVLVLSHAHIDHSGNIPNLVKSGFRGDIVCTYATRDLCSIMLRDSGYIQEQDIDYVNKKRRRDNLPPVEPIYTVADAVESLKNFVGIGYHRPYRLAPGITLIFHDAGHMLGSAIVALDIEDQQAGHGRRLVFSGDLGRANRPILQDPEFLRRADLLILESTYGSRLHPDDEPAEEALASVVNGTIAREGKVIIPAFAVGRTQELVYRFYRLIQAGRIPEIPIFVDSPLAINATGIYQLHPEAFDREMSKLLLNGQDPFSMEKMRYTRAVEESKALRQLKGPAIIISASGMAENGRILHHLRNHIENRRNTILIVGWQAPDTLGRRLVEKNPEVRIFGKPYRVRAEVVVMNGFSGHADRQELLDWAGHLSPPPAHTYLVHGEEEAAAALAEGLAGIGFPDVQIPYRGQEFIL